MNHPAALPANYYLMVGVIASYAETALHEQSRHSSRGNLRLPRVWRRRRKEIPMSETELDGEKGTAEG
jgi:phosphomevalonate kinase